MTQTARWIIIVLASFILIVQLPPDVKADPTAFECIENPDMEGCPDTGGSEEDGDTQSSVQSAEDRPSLGWTILRLVLVLVLVLALIYGLLKFFNKKNKLFNRNRTMENLGGMNLAPNRSVQAVRIGDQVFILGVGETVQMVTEVTDEKTRKALLDQDTPSMEDKGFSRIFDKISSGEKKQSGNSAVQFQNLFDKQLQDMKKKARQLREESRRDRDDE